MPPRKNRMYLSPELESDAESRHQRSERPSYIFPDSALLCSWIAFQHNRNHPSKFGS